MVKLTVKRAGKCLEKAKFVNGINRHPT